MSVRRFTFLHFPSTKILHPSKPTSPPLQLQTHISSKPMMLPAPNSSSSAVHPVPGLSASEIHCIADQTFQRYHISPSSSTLKRSSGVGVSIIWFRYDLRVLDNEVLFKAWLSSQTVLPVYCVDPRQFGTTYHFGFPKTGVYRAQFLTESLTDLKNNLKKHGLDLLIRHGKPEEVLPSLAKAYGAHTVFAQKETCSEELTVERNVSKALKQISFVSSSSKKSYGSDQSRTCKLELLWGSTLYHIDDLPFDAYGIPDVYTRYRKSVESNCNVRGCVKIPPSLGPTPQIEDWGCVPNAQDLVGNHDVKVNMGCLFLGGESTSLSRTHEYIWKKDLLRTYKETRNGMLGPDYSTKFSPWLAYGCLSPRLIYEEVKRYEKERISNDSTYWVLFELIWRDYFRFLSVKYGNSIFQVGGPRKLRKSWSQDKTLFEAWKEGRTGYPLIDANMKELSTTGFMSNRGRQIVCSFLVRDMGIDWRMGAEWFETCLLDYDPCSNYGNWTYGAGVGNDPREDRYFSIPKQVYDPDGEYAAFWLPELRRLPKAMRHSPGNAYVKPVVSLKFGKLGKVVSQESASAMRQSNFRRR